MISHDYKFNMPQNLIVKSVPYSLVRDAFSNIENYQYSEGKPETDCEAIGVLVAYCLANGADNKALGFADGSCPGSHMRRAEARLAEFRLRNIGGVYSDETERFISKIAVNKALVHICYHCIGLSVDPVVCFDAYVFNNP